MGGKELWEHLYEQAEYEGHPDPAEAAESRMADATAALIDRAKDLQDEEAFDGVS